jgi:hypothetical protein
VQHLPNKHKALASIPSIAKKNKNLNKILMQVAQPMPNKFSLYIHGGNRNLFKYIVVSISLEKTYTALTFIASVISQLDHFLKPIFQMRKLNQAVEVFCFPESNQQAARLGLELG